MSREVKAQRSDLRSGNRPCPPSTAPASARTSRSRAPHLSALGLWLALLLPSLLATQPAHAQLLPPGVYPCLTNDIPAGYATFVLAKSVSFQQLPGSGVTEISPPSAVASIELTSPPSLLYSNAVVAGPEGFRAELDDVGNGTSRWVRSFANEPNLWANPWSGPASTRLDVTLADGSSFLGFFRFNNTLILPPIPRISNLSDLTEINTRSNLVVTWPEWTNAAAGDRIHFEIRNANDETVFSASTGCGGEVTLPPGATSVTVPANRLGERLNYSGYLTFSANTMSTQERGSRLLLRGVYARTTRFNVRTAGSESSDVTLSDPRISAAGTSLLFTITGTPRATYFIQSSTNFATWNLERVTVIPINGSANVSLPLPRDGTPRFWRAVAPDLAQTTPKVSLNFFNQNRDFMQIVVEGTPGIAYRVEMTSDLINWQPLTPFGLNIPANANRITLGLPFNRNNPFTAFRAVTAPPR